MLLDLFGKMLEMSLIGCYVIAIVLVIRLLLHKCERKYSYALWFVVFLNLCLPFTIEGPFSLIPGRLVEQEVIENRSVAESNLVTVDKEITTHGMESAVANTGSGSVAAEVGNASGNSSEPGMDETSGWKPVGNLNMSQSYVNDEVPEMSSQIAKPQNSEEMMQELPAVEEVQTPATAEAGGPHLLWTVAGGVWLLVATGILGVSLIKGILLSKKLKKSRKEQEFAGEGVVLTEDISAPFLWGIWRPLIYLPTDVEEEERIYILAHERYHKKRFDHITKPVVFVIVALHWFNPLVWLAYALFVRDMEISCDEAVLAQAEGSIKKQYASSLLKYAAGQNGFVLAPLTFGEPSLKSRIKNVLGYKKRGMVVTIAAICVVALTACGLILRPQTEEPGEDKGGLDGKEPGVEVTQEPETTELPQATQVPDVFENSPYSVYFQDILQAKTEENAGKYYFLEIRKPALNYSYVESAQDYKEQNAAYSATRDIYLTDGGVVKIDWLKLSEDVILTDLVFDMGEEMLQSGSEQNSLHAVFYDEKKKEVSVCVSSIGEAVTWMICFSPENPTDYDIYVYEYSSWFGESCFIGNHIYLHGGSGETPFVIDTDTKEGRLCTAEYTAAKVATYNMSAEYGKSHKEVLGVEWMMAFARWEDVDIFSALLMEAMDIFPGVAEVYVASRDGEVLEVMIVEIETGEVTIVEDFSELTATRPLSQREIKWFNESFFNQGYLQEGTAALEGIRNQFLTHEYARPEDIDVSEIFYNGAGEEMTENDWLCISGEARWKYPLYTGKMVLLTEQEHKEVAQFDVDVSRVSFDTMDTVMETYTGLSTWGTRGMESLYFNKHDGVYYKFHGDTNTVFVQVKEGHYNTDGTISLYYVRNGSSNWIEEEVDLYVVVLRPIRNGYQFVSNQKVGASHVEMSGTTVEEKTLDLSPYPEYFGVVLKELQDSGNYWLESKNVESVQEEGRYCEKELTDARALIADFADRCEEVDGVRPDVWNFGACSRVGDVDIYYGNVSQEMEDINPKAGIYTAYCDGEYLGALLIDMRTGEIYYTTGKPAEAASYSLYAVENEKYNAVFEYNKLQYRFRLDMDTTNLFLRLGEEQTKENPTGSWTITPVYASNGEFEVFLGNLRGKVNKVFEITVDSAPLAEYSLEGESLYGIMGEVKDGKMTILPMEEKDREPYEMYDMHVVETAVTYSLAENVEYGVLDANFREAHTTAEYFKEHMGKTVNQVCYFVVKDGVILHIGEPYIP